jgi:predicted 3-demethylubiquinone-9 3-methyltransferase (glyoxalase superfamily)
MPIISSMLWFDSEAEEAANFYVSIFPNSRILAVVHRPPNVPAPGGEVMVVDFELDGVRVSALNGGPMFQFSEAFSYTVHCKDQAEIDYYWDALLAGRGQESACGWLKDRYGFSWQITPAPLLAILAEDDPVRVEKAMAAVMTMRKLDLAVIMAAVEG